MTWTILGRPECICKDVHPSIRADRFADAFAHRILWGTLWCGLISWYLKQVPKHLGDDGLGNLVHELGRHITDIRDQEVVAELTSVQPKHSQILQKLQELRLCRLANHCLFFYDAMFEICEYYH